MSRQPSMDRYWWVAGRAALTVALGSEGYGTVETPSGWCAATALRYPHANWFGWYGSGDGVDEAFDASVRLLQERGVPGVGFAAPACADRLAARAGNVPVQRAGSLPWMMLSADRIPDRSDDGRFEVARVEDPASVAQARDLIAVAFNVPTDLTDRFLRQQLATGDHLALYLGQEAGEPVTTAIIYRDGPLAYVHTMATDPGKRRRGAARALLTAAMAEEAAGGATEFCLIASVMGETLYRALGWETIDACEFWVVNAG